MPPVTAPVRGWGDLVAVVPTMTLSRHPEALRGLPAGQGSVPIPEHPRAETYRDIAAALGATPGLLWEPSPTAAHPDTVRASLSEWADANAVIPVEHRRADAVGAYTLACHLAAVRGAVWALYVEDDVWPGPDFPLIPRLIAEADRRLGPDLAVVAFFSRRTAHDAPGLHRFTAADLPNTVCNAIRVSALADWRSAPDGRTSRFQAFATEWYAATGHVHASDLLLAAWLSRANASPWFGAAWSPSVVQHRVGPSTFSHRPDTRISETYRRRYGEAPGYGPTDPTTPTP